jgi:hypothetical protein
VLISFTSNHGALFMSAVWAALCCQLHIQNSLTTNYHPLFNGLMERFTPSVIDHTASLGILY